MKYTNLLITSLFLNIPGATSIEYLDLAACSSPKNSCSETTHQVLPSYNLVTYETLDSYLQKIRTKKKISEQTFFSLKSKHSSIHLCAEKIIKFLNQDKEQKKSRVVAAQYIDHLYRCFKEELNDDQKDHLRDIIIEISQKIIVPTTIEYSNNQKILAQLMKSKISEESENTAHMHFTVINYYLNSVNNESDPVKISQTLQDLTKSIDGFIFDDKIEEDYEPDNSDQSLNTYIIHILYRLREVTKKAKILEAIISSEYFSE